MLKMGQYYLVVFLSEDKKSIVGVVYPGFGRKLTEHSIIGNPLFSFLTQAISPTGNYYMSRIVWAGDYADPEEDTGENLYTMAQNYDGVIFNNNRLSYRYIINHSKQLYVDLSYISDYSEEYHPLPMLTAEGNGRGTGDYNGVNDNLVGTWARDVISANNDVPTGFTELKCNFCYI